MCYIAERITRRIRYREPLHKKHIIKITTFTVLSFLKEDASSKASSENFTVSLTNNTACRPKTRPAAAAC